MNDTIITISSILGAVGGWEAVKYLINRKTNKRVEEANAFKIQREAIIEDYKRVQGEVDELKKKVDELYKRVHILEEEKLSLISENNELRLQLKEAEKHICLQPDDACLQRLNDRPKCRLVGLLRGEYTKDHPNAIVTPEDMKRPKKEINIDQIDDDGNNSERYQEQ